MEAGELMGKREQAQSRQPWWEPKRSVQLTDQLLQAVESSLHDSRMLRLAGQFERLKVLVCIAILAIPSSHILLDFLCHHGTEQGAKARKFDVRLKGVASCGYSMLLTQDGVARLSKGLVLPRRLLLDLLQGTLHEDLHRRWST